MRRIVRESLGTVLRWTGGWACLGLVVGLLLMLGRTPPFAESGRKPDDVGFYSFWIPVAGVGGAVFGLALGAVFACLMAVSRRWRDEWEAGPDSVMRHVPRLLCGAAAGCIVGAIGGPAGAVIGAIAGTGSAGASAVSAWMPRRRRVGTSDR